ncbi:MAG TPA: AI-2E family transporter [Acidimicrobiales bacterium]|nr:AI-2E family transporter [Acidimicrobiales bacterium]
MVDSDADGAAESRPAGTGAAESRPAGTGAADSRPDSPVKEVDLDWRSVAWVMVAFVGLLALTALIRGAPRAIGVLAVGTLLALALDALVSRATRMLGGHRAAGVAAVLLALLALVVLAGVLLIPRAIEQGRQLSGDTDRVVRQIEDLPVIGDDLQRAGTADAIRRGIESLPDRLEGEDTPLVGVAATAADGLLVAFFTSLITISLLLDGHRLLRGGRRLVPAPRRPQADRLGRLAYETFGRYMAGSLLVAGIAGTAVLTVGLILQVPLTPLLAVWVAIFDLVPQIGGAAGGIPFVLLGFTRSATTGVICAVFFVLYLQFENHILSPLVVGRSVKLSPPATMTAALVGVSAGGVVGALLAVPVVAAGKAAYLELRPTARDDRGPDRVGSGDATDAAGGRRMSTVEKSIEVELPVSTVYNQWTQFEEFPQFMGGVESVTQLDDTRLHWVAEIAGVRREWDAEIVDQQPDQRIAWRSIDGAGNGGVVTFQPLGASRTEVNLQMEFEPEGLAETVGDKLGFVSKQAEGDLERFKSFIEQRGAETGAWRGQV